MSWGFKRLEVIQFQDPTNRTLVQRYPEQGTAAIQLGAQLIVEQSQEAVFFRDGKAMDAFGPGRYTLSTQNVPILTALLTIPWEKSPFQAAVFFVGKQTFIDQKWGTAEAITVRDADFGMVRLRAYGKYAFRVIDSATFINTIVGTQGKTTDEQVTNYLRTAIVSRLTDLLGTSKLSLLDLPAKFDEISAGTRAKVGEEFRKYGLELSEFYVSAITPPEEVQKAIDARSSMGAIGDLQRYTVYQAANSMSKMAEQSGDGGGLGAGAMGMGMGAGFGMMFPGMIREAMQYAGPNQGGGGGQAPPPAGAVPPGSVPPGSAGGGTAAGAGAIAGAGGLAGLSFDDLQRVTSRPAVDPRELVQAVANSSGWKLDNSREPWEITVSINNLRKQVVRVRFDRTDESGAQVLSFSSSCGPMDEKNASALLKYNTQILHGAFAIESTPSGEQVVLQCNELAQTTSALDVSRAISQLAWQADKVEEKLTGEDKN
ncbi:MAG TPA: SPFH domain-containing protein [Pirellulaceae bacterium]|jgi:membrane protease subunit (stomatin/prohibitin family)|nr:SPFH domain-containing protein [Pirellulaceae bacterium]